MLKQRVVAPSTADIVTSLPAVTQRPLSTVASPVVSTQVLASCVCGCVSRFLEIVEYYC
jgi:hypothetical protein